MSETYCGKNCEECTYKEKLNCSGCLNGPGKLRSGDCSIAVCCWEKKHIDCESCTSKGYCGTLQNCHNMPDYRIEKIEAEKARMEEKAKKAQFLGKWLWLLFWLVIPNNIAGILTQENIVSWFPAVKIPGEIISLFYMIAYSMILLKISSENMNYRTAGISKLLAFMISIVAEWVSGYGIHMLVLILGLLIALVGTYFEFMGHGDVVFGFDAEISGKWNELWKWYLRSMLGQLGSVVLMLLSPILGAMLYLAAAVGYIIVSIWRWICLFKTARVIRKNRTITMEVGK